MVKRRELILKLYKDWTNKRAFNLWICQLYDVLCMMYDEMSYSGGGGFTMFKTSKYFHLEKAKDLSINYLSRFRFFHFYSLMSHFNTIAWFLTHGIVHIPLNSHIWRWSGLVAINSLERFWNYWLVGVINAVARLSGL